MAAASDGLTFSEIVSTTRLAKASAHRLLRDLVDLSALSYDDRTRRYRGGLKLAKLGGSVIANYDLRRAVRPVLERLHESTGLVTTLGIRDDDTGIYIDKIEPDGLMFRLHSEIGKSFPLHSTALGKALLAHADAAIVGRLTRRKLTRYTDYTITDGTVLREELEQVRRRGYAVDRQEITRGLTCVAAPVRSIEGRVTAALSCTTSSFDTNDKQLTKLADRVVRYAAQASEQG